jgi:phosphoglycolate phosphatase
MTQHADKLSPGAVFDLDGTILDTIRDLMDSMNRALKLLGFKEHDLKAYKTMVGNGNLKLSIRSLPPESRDEETVRRLFQAFKEDYAIHQLDATRPYPGIPEFLAKLKGLGWPLAVLSNKDHENAVAVVTRYFPGVFDVILGVVPQIRPPKPDPAGAREAISIMKREPKDIYYFGDTDVDMVLASDMGFFPVGVSWGFRTPESITKAGAKIMLDNPEEFFSHLESRSDSHSDSK